MKRILLTALAVVGLFVTTNSVNAGSCHAAVSVVRTSYAHASYGHSYGHSYSPVAVAVPYPVTIAVPVPVATPALLAPQPMAPVCEPLPAAEPCQTYTAPAVTYAAPVITYAAPTVSYGFAVAAPVYSYSSYTPTVSYSRNVGVVRVRNVVEVDRVRVKAARPAREVTKTRSVTRTR